MDDPAGLFQIKNKILENSNAFYDKTTSRDQQYIHKDDVLKEVDEKHEEEKVGETPKNKRPESESNSRLKDKLSPVEQKKSDSKAKAKEDEEMGKQASNDIDIRIDDNW